MHIKAVFTIAVCYFGICLASGGSKDVIRNRDIHETLIHTLLQKDPIVYRVRPVERSEDPVNITFGLSLQVIENLDEKKQVLTIRVEFYQSWYDYQLKWNPADHGGITAINISPKLIWTPDIFLYNNADDRFGRGRKRINALVNYEGKVTHDFPAVFKTTCTLKIEKYPFDKQSCKIRLGSWSYPRSELIMHLRDDKVDLSHYTTNGEWELKSATMRMFDYANAENSWDSVLISLEITRLSLYHAMYYIIPCAMIGLMTIIVFVLPVNINERMTVGLTLLIALSFFFLLMAENLPAIAETIPVAASYYSAMTILSACAYFMTCIVLKCHFSNPLEGDAPNWIRVLVLDYIARLLFMKEYDDGESKDEVEPPPAQITSYDKDKKIKSMTKEERRSNSVIRNSVRHRAILDGRTEEWNKIAHSLFDDLPPNKDSSFSNIASSCRFDGLNLEATVCSLTVHESKRRHRLSCVNTESRLLMEANDRSESPCFQEDVNNSSNPPRPPLTEEEKEIIESDKIGDSVYSKKWVLGVLVHMVEDIKRFDKEVPEEEESSNSKDGRNKEPSVEGDSTEVLVEMNPKLEEELCELWDMTMDSDVSRYLQEEDVIDLILDSVMETKALRKLEICLGILANMACTSDVCETIVKHPTLSEIVLFHIDNPDVRTLIELSRLINVCLSNKGVCQDWIKSLKSRKIVDKLVFILENSLNAELLDIVSDVVDKLLDYDDELLDELSTTKTVRTICDVYRRTATKRPQIIQNLLHVLQMISTTEKGVSALASVEDSSNIARIILVESSNYFTPLDSNLPSLVSSCSILNARMTTREVNATEIEEDGIKVFSTILSLTESLYEKISHLNEDEEDVDLKNEMFVDKAYFSAVTDFLAAMVDAFSTTEVSKELCHGLKEKEEQILRVLNILRESSTYANCSVEKMLRFTNTLNIMQAKDGL
eukprot:gene18036-19842_t